MVMVFNTTYYSHKNFLHATSKGGDSFIKSGIWTAKEAMKKEFKWVVKDGKKIEVFRDH